MDDGVDDVDEGKPMDDDVNEDLILMDDDVDDVNEDLILMDDDVDDVDEDLILMMMMWMMWMKT